MKQSRQITLGVLLVAAGVLLGLNSLGFTHIDLFFDGWWTLFIIVPSLMGLINGGDDKAGDIIGLCIGIVLLLCSRDILDFSVIWKLVLPLIIVFFGLKMIFESFRADKMPAVLEETTEHGPCANEASAVFSSEKINMSGEVFRSAELNAVFGGLEYDLRNAIIESDCIIKASAIFGGIDIYVPNNVNIRISSNSIFGGVSNKTANNKNDNAHTLYIKANCLFGGVDIK